MVSNLDYYKSFYWVATLRSFTQAAEKLFVSQSAVSQSIHKLEDELGCVLFERTGRILNLTAEGEALLFHVRHAIDELLMGEAVIARSLSLSNGELMVGATETSVRYFLSSRIRTFKQRYPNIRITFHGATTRELCELLQNGAIEIALLISPIPEPYSFELTRIAEFTDIPVVSAAYSLDAQSVYSPADLTRMPLISVTKENAVRQVLDEWFRSDGVELLPDFTVKNMNLVLAMVLDGFGVGFLPEMIAQNDIERSNLIRLKTNSLPKPRTLYIATRSGVPISDIARAFMAMFESSMPGYIPVKP